MLEWSTDEDFWVRRIAIDHQLCRKERTNTELLSLFREELSTSLIGVLSTYTKSSMGFNRFCIEPLNTSLSFIAVFFTFDVNCLVFGLI